MSYIKSSMDKAKIFKNYTMQELLDELDIIERLILSSRAYTAIGRDDRKAEKALKFYEYCRTVIAIN